MNIPKQEHLTDIERQKVLFDWNATQTDYPLDKCLHQLIEEQVERSPDAIAVIFNRQKLTYRELNNRANQLAHYLQSLEVKADSLVGICVERSLEMVIGILGIIKAGAAYVPLDSSYPQERLAFMVEDASVDVLLTQQNLMAHLPPSNAKNICLDSDWTTIAQFSYSNPELNVTPDNLAYMIYTSGSTGKPKGALNEHRGICNRLLWMQATYQLNSSDRILQKTPFSFDVSVWEFFWTLISGACLVVAKPEGHKDPDYLIEIIKEQQITTLHFVPPMLHILLETADLSHCTSIRRVICSGEALPYSLQQRFFAQTPAELHNLYGPTEAAIDVSYWQCHANSTLAIVPIGRPVANTQLYILNEQGQPTPIGVAGELHIGGVQVGRGYHNRPELTAEKFIPNPFAEGRLYRTGDLARYLPDGEIEYIGRIDNQIKLRGFRIELGEIETALIEQSTVKQAVVLVHEDKFGDKQLVSYIVANPEAIAEAQADDAKNYVSLWQSLYEETYRQTSAATADDLTFNINGWNSTYTNQPIPEAEMREWVEQTVAKILNLKPQNVLELGCGTGLLLSRIAPHCEHYVGADISATGLEHIRTVQKTIGGLDNITLLERAADDLADFSEGSFDTIIINSVIQHFPDVAYLLKVLQRAARLIKAGGRIFVGDVPNFLQRETFHSSVSIYRATDNDTVAQVWQRIHQQMDAEKDLQFSPAFFLALTHHIPELRHVQVQPKPGHSRNQLTLFRQDVLLHLGSVKPIVQDLNWIYWHDLIQTEQLLHKKPSILAVRNIPNARLSLDVCALNWLHEANSEATIAECRHYVEKHAATGIEPENIREMARSFGYFVELSWLNSDVNGSYDAVFTRDDLPQQLATFTTATPNRTLTNYANNPQHTKLNRLLIPQLRHALQAQLPEYMIPAIFTLVDEMPLSPSGKIDRKALAELPIDFDFVREEILVEAHNPFEKLLVNVWADVLDLTHIGVEDDFFALGGNSLKAMMVAGRLQRLFGRDIPALGVFTASTISSFAPYLLNLYPDLAKNSVSTSLEEREEGEI
ncbi:MAG: amino acid adenylation domain-containing protein [Methylococcaceae bacterium]